MYLVLVVLLLLIFPVASVTTEAALPRHTGTKRRAKPFIFSAVDLQTTLFTPRIVYPRSLLYIACVIVQLMLLYTHVRRIRPQPQFPSRHPPAPVLPPRR